jgi:uncharacterized membrane protein
MIWEMGRYNRILLHVYILVTVFFVVPLAFDAPTVASPLGILALVTAPFAVAGAFLLPDDLPGVLTLLLIALFALVNALLFIRLATMVQRWRRERTASRSSGL